MIDLLQNFSFGSALLVALAALALMFIVTISIRPAKPPPRRRECDRIGRHALRAGRSRRSRTWFDV